jgi:hypothetical protein
MGPEEKIIKKWLDVQEKVFDGRSVWRLVWSEGLTEKRKGEFNDFYGEIFIRSYYGIRECRKYNHIHERFILEKWGPGKRHEDIEMEDERAGYYEPFFVFEDGKGEYLKPTLKVVQFIINFARQDVKTTDSERKRLVELAEDAEIKNFMNLIEEHGRTPTESLLHSREGVSMYIPQDPIKKLLFGG